MASSRPDLEALLQDGNIIRIRPQGYSMYPLFIPGRDEADRIRLCRHGPQKRCRSLPP